MSKSGPFRLKRLEVENFRGFEKLALDFEDDLTVIVGANGAGKTTVLDAIVRAKRAQRQVTAYGEFFENADGRVGASTVAVRLTACESDGETHVTKVTATFPRAEDDYCHGGWLPQIFVYRVNRQVNDQTPDAASTSYSKNWSAIAHWYDASASYKDFFHWFKSVEDMENEQIRYENGSANPQLAAVRRAIRALLPEFTEMRIRRQMPLFADKPVLVLRKGDVELPFDALSEGERTTIAMVGDIARRLVLLGEHEDPLQTSATVLIDEIEQHAHPGWQRQILRRFRHTFPNIQLITTTHSPIIVSEVEPRQLRVLKSFALVPPEHGPGRDANTVLEDVFEVPPRKQEVQDALNALASAIDNEEFEKADRLLADLDVLIPGGADPDIVYYRNLLAMMRAS
jgi:predicted ATP-binding protein involved in virulence